MIECLKSHSKSMLIGSLRLSEVCAYLFFIDEFREGTYTKGDYTKSCVTSSLTGVD